MKDRRWAWSAAITAVFAVTVIWAAAHHEPWRDEVVPLSIARRAHSLSELTAPLRFESHPIGWYLLLWWLQALIAHTWVLKAASLGSAIGAVFLISRSPLPWWLVALFTFSFLPLYQFSVISRGYSLEMAVLFAFCALYPHRREHPLALAVVLAALANTEAFGTIMAVAAGVMILSEGVMDVPRFRRIARDPSALAAVALYVAGLLAAALVSFPDASHRGTGIRQLDLATLATAIADAIVRPVAHSAPMSLVVWPSLWVWAYFAYLARTPPLLAFTAVALIGIELLFNLVPHLRAVWHYGNVVLVLVAAMWLDASRSIAALAPPSRIERSRVWLGRILTAGVCLVLAQHVVLGVASLTQDFRYDYSSSPRLAELLGRDPALADAVLMGEPDGPLWSLPYYADHRIYLAREGTYRDWGVFAPPRQAAFDLGALLASAQRVGEECGCPVVITLGFDVGQLGVHTEFGGTRFEETFQVTAPDRDRFLAATQLLAAFRGPTLTDERYDVYVLRR